jgi:hypothetical protein
VPTAVEVNEIDCIESVGLTAIAGPTRDERRCNDVTVKAVLLEDSLKDEAGAGGFIARPYRAFLGQAAKEAPGLVEIAGEVNHLWALHIAIEDGGGDGI